jgi:hypothetical protein
VSEAASLREALDTQRTQSSILEAALRDVAEKNTAALGSVRAELNAARAEAKSAQDHARALETALRIERERADDASGRIAAAETLRAAEDDAEKASLRKRSEELQRAASAALDERETLRGQLTAATAAADQAQELLAAQTALVADLRKQRSMMAEQVIAARLRAQDDEAEAARLRAALAEAASFSTASVKAANSADASARDAAGARAPQPAVPPASREPDKLVQRAVELLERRDYFAARLLLARAVENGNPSAAFRLAETYDPGVLAVAGAFGVKPDPKRARELYDVAAKAGVTAALDRLHSLRGEAP